MPSHKNTTTGNNHITHSWEFENQAVREKSGGFVQSDLHKLALQMDTLDFYRLTSIDPENWELIGSNLSTQATFVNMGQNDIKTITNPLDTQLNRMVQVFEQSNTTGLIDTSLDFDLGDEGLFIQQDAANGTDFIDGKVQLHTVNNPSLVDLATSFPYNSNFEYVNMGGKRHCFPSGGVLTGLIVRGWNNIPTACDIAIIDSNSMVVSRHSLRDGVSNNSVLANSCKFSGLSIDLPVNGGIVFKSLSMSGELGGSNGYTEGIYVSGPLPEVGQSVTDPGSPTYSVAFIALVDEPIYPITRQGSTIIGDTSRTPTTASTEHWTLGTICVDRCLTVNVAGSITQCSFRTNGAVSSRIFRMVVFRPQADNTYTLVGKSNAIGVASGYSGVTSITVSVPIVVQLGDLVGLWSNGYVDLISTSGVSGRLGGLGGITTATNLVIDSVYDLNFSYVGLGLLNTVSFTISSNVDGKRYITTSDQNHLSVDQLGISLFEGLSITKSEPTGTSVKALVSFDGRTTWNKYLPAILGNSSCCTGGTASAGGSVTSYNPDGAFNGLHPVDWTTGWYFNSWPSGNEWLQYQFGSMKVISKITIWSTVGAGTEKVASFILKGSNDGTNFTTITSGNLLPASNWSASYQVVNESVTFNNTTPYLYYRLYPIFEGTNGADGANIVELEMFEMTQIPGFQPVSGMTFDSDCTCSAMESGFSNLSADGKTYIDFAFQFESTNPSFTSSIDQVTLTYTEGLAYRAKSASEYEVFILDDTTTQVKKLTTGTANSVKVNIII